MGYYAAIVREVVARMDYHTKAGQILAGLTFLDKPTVRIEGLKDFPTAVLFLPEVTEVYRPNVIAGGSLVINIAVCTKRELGVAVMLEWAEKVLDALETKRDGSGELDANLGGTTKPFTATIGGCFPLDLSLNAQVSITVMPKPMDRGQRRNS